MRILVTAATGMELQAVRPALVAANPQTEFAETGIGIAATACRLTAILARHHFDLALNVGIAGSFTDSLSTGDVVAVREDCFGDLGVSSPEGFSTCFEEKLIAPDSPPFTDGVLKSARADATAQRLGIASVKGVTNSTASGDVARIALMQEKFAPDIETMETAAFFYACLCENVPFVAIRAISNRIEPRNKSNWNIPLALLQLSVVSKQLL
jgi:futalosine hydrolase